jgi:serine/threonine-protein kinase
VLFGGGLISLVAAFLLSAWRVILRLRGEVEAARSVGQYTLLERLGEGGMGVVYKARHALLRRPTAVKILLRERAAESDFKRFEREVQITGRLTHPNTVVVFDYGRTPDRRFYYAMEYIDGITLERLITTFGPQPPGRVVHILTQACGALAEAHAAGLIHRDIKPANFMLCQRGGVPDFLKVFDFGMVKEGDVVSEVSETGVSYGTPLYLSPEAISDPRKIDHRADLYALGLVGYYLLAGTRAVGGESLAEVMHQHLQITPPPPSKTLGAALPAGLEAIIMKCLSKDPNDRPATAGELRAALLELKDVPPWTTEMAAEWWASRKGQLTSPSQPLPAQPMDVAFDERSR